jgi:predicted MFS family arabinose efflux permease
VADTEVALAALLVLSGLLLAPTTVVGSTLLDTVAPSGTVTEAFTVMVMAIVVGTAMGNAVGGAIVESASYETAVLWAGVAAVAGAALTLVRRRTLA